MKRMRLELTKVDTQGLKIPRISEENEETPNGCARTLPVGRVVSCKRTTPVNQAYRRRVTRSVRSEIHDPDERCKPADRPANPELADKPAEIPVLKPANPSVAELDKPAETPVFKPAVKPSTNPLVYQKRVKIFKRKLTKHRKVHKYVLPQSAKDCAGAKYSSTLQKTLDKITGQKAPKKKRRSSSVHKKSLMVKYKFEDIRKPKLQSTVRVETIGEYASTGIQVERGYIVDQEVMDSYVSVKVNEILKEKLKHTEEQVLKVLKEKERMEKILKEKILMLRELTRTDFKPYQQHKAANTDPISIETPTPPTVASAKPQKKQPKKSRIRRRHIETQTVQEDFHCLQFVRGRPLAPYLRSQSSSPPAVTPEPESLESESEKKIEWMFTDFPCARARALRPQVRLLRSLKIDLAKYKPSKYNLEGFDSIIPHEVGWDAFGPHLQTNFIRIFKLCEIMEFLPLELCLKKKSDIVVKALKHLLSHLPFPVNLTVTKVSPSESSAYGAYLLGWKLKELIGLLQQVCKSNFSSILPLYIQAEIIQADKLSRKIFQFVTQGIRNTSIDHSALHNDEEFIINSSTFPDPFVDSPVDSPAASPFMSSPSALSISEKHELVRNKFPVDWYSMNDVYEFDSSSISDGSEEIPPPKQKVRSGESCIGTKPAKKLKKKTRNKSNNGGSNQPKIRSLQPKPVKQAKPTNVVTDGGSETEIRPRQQIQPTPVELLKSGINSDSGKPRPVLQQFRSILPKINHNQSKNMATDGGSKKSQPETGALLQFKNTLVEKPEINSKQSRNTGTDGSEILVSQPKIGQLQSQTEPEQQKVKSKNTGIDGDSQSEIRHTTVADVLQNRNIPELSNLSQVVESEIAELRTQSKPLCSLPSTTQTVHPGGSSHPLQISIPSARARARVLCKPLTHNQFTNKSDHVSFSTPPSRMQLVHSSKGIWLPGINHQLSQWKIHPISAANSSTFKLPVMRKVSNATLCNVVIVTQSQPSTISLTASTAGIQTDLKSTHCSVNVVPNQLTSCCNILPNKGNASTSSATCTSDMPHDNVPEAFNSNLKSAVESPFPQQSIPMKITTESNQQSPKCVQPSTDAQTLTLNPNPTEVKIKGPLHTPLPIPLQSMITTESNQQSPKCVQPSTDAQTLTRNPNPTEVKIKGPLHTPSPIPLQSNPMRTTTESSQQSPKHVQQSTALTYLPLPNPNPAEVKIKGPLHTSSPIPLQSNPTTESSQQSPKCVQLSTDAQTLTCLPLPNPNPTQVKIEGPLHTPSSVSLQSIPSQQSPKCVQPSTGAQALADAIKKFQLSRPSIAAKRQNGNKVDIEWSFPPDLHTSVTKYVVYCKSAENHTLRVLGEFCPCNSLPMTATISNLRDSKYIIFLKAIFTNGISSQYSKEITV